METHFDIQLAKLRTRLFKMCSLVDEQVQLALRAIEEEDLLLAGTVVVRDKKVDKYDVKIEKICQKLFALNQPVAMDLRLIMSAMTINTNLERIGDIAVNIAENFILIKKKPAFLEKTKINEMAVLVKEMLRNAIDSFIQNDPKLAEKVIRTDDELDTLNAENHRILIEIMKEDKENIEAAVAFLVTSRSMERIGDHATNIAEDVFFIVEAELIKHKYEKFLFAQVEEVDKEIDAEDNGDD
ncbi:MAG: phosphate signaling complex protein PhoU [Ignavibacteriaceae bacterium]|nr:phosphate signaling complex protein PhoU [Ignavibacteriaceae bacterium]